MPDPSALTLDAPTRPDLRLPAAARASGARGFGPAIVAGVGATFVLAGAAAATGHRLAGRANSTDTSVLAGPLGQLAIITLALLVGAAIPIVAIAVVARGRQGRRGGRRRPVVIVLAAVLLFVVLGGSLNLRRANLRELLVPAQPAAARHGGAARTGASAPTSARDGDVSGWLVAAAGLVGVVGTVAGLAVVLRRRPGLLDPAGPGPGTDAGTAPALPDLDEERDDRKAVILAYRHMEATFAGRGLPRQASEAPLEFSSRVAEATGAPGATALAELYERARFAHRPVDAAMRAAAVRRLRDLQARLEAPA